MTRPTAEYFGLHPMPLDNFLDRPDLVVPAMMNAACGMTEYAVHYDGVFVGACGAIALVSEGTVVFSLGANYKPLPEVPKDCAEWDITRDADILAAMHGDVEIPDLCVASPIGKEKIRNILNTNANTLCPCHDCLVKLAGHPSVRAGTWVHRRRMDNGSSVDESDTIGDLLVALSQVPRPATSDEAPRRIHKARK